MTTTPAQLATLGVGRGPVTSGGGVHSTHSVSFAGSSNQYIEYSGGASVKGQSSYSIAAWFKVTSTAMLTGTAKSIWWESQNGAADTVRTRLLVEGLGGDVNYTGTSMSLTARFRATDGGAAQNMNSGANTIVGNTWYHVLLVFSTTAQALYLNGSLVASTANSYSAVSNTTPASGPRIGSSSKVGGATDEILDGKVDDARMFLGTALTATDASNLFSGQDVQTGISDYWTFDEGSGTSAGDSIGSATGTLTNGVTWSTDVPGPIT